mgnify:CR=1 FL=1
MAEILAVCLSEKKGVQKTDVGRARLIENFGMEGDAHAGNWHRQVSLLDADKIAAFNAKGADAAYGAFGENIVAAMDFRSLPVGTLLRAGDALLEITQIGKACHNGCAIFEKMGDCIMPREGVFARVLKGGEIKVGDAFELVPREGKRPYQAAVITLSDKGARGERKDESGLAIVKRLTDAGYEVIETLLLPDDGQQLKAELIRLTDQRQTDLILTTGGTGFTARDITPEATLAVGDKTVPGIPEAMRAYSMQFTPRAMFSRGVCVIRKKSLILNLPGSLKAVNESLDAVMETLPHALDMLRGSAGDCGR